MTRPMLPLALLLAVPFAAAAAADPPSGVPTVDRSLMAGDAAMDRAMRAAPMTGNPDRDFVAMMIPHHQGAISMAEVELRDGRDPALRRLAHAIVDAQRTEIATMRRWQARHPATPSAHGS